jgi:hypothetical protein
MILFVFVTLLVAVPSTKAQDARRYATCDVCGYCINSQNPADWPEPPGSWAKCRACLYENASEDPKSGDTLVVDPETNIPPQPHPGRHYTVFGCIKTNIGDFTQTGAASSLVQVLLNIIFYIAGGVALMYIIYGSILIMTSQADSERLAHGKRVVTGSIIGLVLALFSVFIVNLIASGILHLPGFSQSPINSSQ